DQYGRGSTAFNGLDVSCDAVNTELRCQAVATNQHGLYVYCPVQQDVTQVAVWAVDDVAVAAVVAPGTFHAAGTGDTVIRVAWQNLKASAKPVSVFPGTPPLPTQEISGSVYQTGKTV